MGIYEASVEQAFTARHAVRLADGSWEKPHEHHWSVSATFRARRLGEPMGVVVDFLDLRAALEAIAGQFQGTDLRDHPAFAECGASAERLAEFVARRLMERMQAGPSLYRVSVTEAPGCSAAFYPRGGGP